MQLTAKEHKQVRKLLTDDNRPGMILWTEPQANGDTCANGYVEGDPIEIVMMTIHAINFAARAAGMSPKDMSSKLATIIASREN